MQEKSSNKLNRNNNFLIKGIISRFNQPDWPSVTKIGESNQSVYVLIKKKKILNIDYL